MRGDGWTTRWWRPPLWYRIGTVFLCAVIVPGAAMTLAGALLGKPSEYSVLHAVMALVVTPTLALEANRSRIGIGYPGISFRSVATQVTLPWADVRDLWAHRSGIWAVLQDGSTVRVWPLGTSRVVNGVGLGGGGVADEVVAVVRDHLFGDGRPGSAPHPDQSG